MSKKHTLEEMQALAESKGGRCLSTTYVNISTKLKWQCKEKHEWEAMPTNILNRGAWCPKCARIASSGITIEDIEKLASRRGGYCLSDKYIDGKKTKMEWMCKYGHIWWATTARIKLGHWCPECKEKEKEKKDGELLQQLFRIAAEKGGRCLSRKYLGERSNLSWECKEKHQFEAFPRSIKQGVWCPTCGGRNQSIEDMRALAREKGGECLSDVYLGTSVKLKWRCKKGHEWLAKPSGVKRGKWCLLCSGKAKKNIDDMRALAEQHGGQCLSTSYQGMKVKLLWKCSKGHEWLQRPDYIQLGHWCSTCKAENKRRGSQK